jgi:type I restriction enzyme M protein
MALASELLVAGWCETLNDIRSHRQVLTLGRYVGAEAAQGGFGAKEEVVVKGLTAALCKQTKEPARLDSAIAAKFTNWGFGCSAKHSASANLVASLPLKRA